MNANSQISLCVATGKMGLSCYFPQCTALCMCTELREAQISTDHVSNNLFYEAEVTVNTSNIYFLLHTLIREI